MPSDQHHHRRPLHYDSAGRVISRIGDEDSLCEMGRSLNATIEGHIPDKRESTSKLKPSLRYFGYVDEVIRNAGPSASRDLLRSSPPMLLGACLAGVFKRSR